MKAPCKTDRSQLSLVITNDICCRFYGFCAGWYRRHLFNFYHKYMKEKKPADITLSAHVAFQK